MTRTVQASVAMILLALTAIVGLAPGSAFAFPAFSDWPSRTVKIIVPFPGGSPNDIAGRTYAAGLAKRWRRPVTVEGRLDAEMIAAGGPLADVWDDHTLLYGTAGMIATKPLVRRAPAEDHVLDMAPICSGARTILVIAVSSSLPARSLRDLVELARSRPGELTWSAGPSVPHLAFATSIRRHGLHLLQVPYRDAATARADLRDGRVHVLSHSLPAVADLVAQGQARILAVTSPQREPALADIPTVTEAGFPEMSIENLSGLFGSRAMPPEVRDRIAADMRAVARDGALVARLEANGQRALGSTPADFAAAIGRYRIRVQQILHIVDPKAY
ncbi:tripartite tricarboxylate transporter substrate binding protein [Bradyrhizobium sp. LHD-71]|uniref:Bug family tripartite tricarboxylate transporter substrate binding protein n=1 Tax=Bradyrhizobium sp. LHD-71 TaxID=3072141 RepID=UPI00280FEE38|nr:tripartite tricarboxylate transporter substrate binding protein [Bradyrhizobium sp. LHD-71]MDQ8731846.1 tripartite tricarboxylate transporter substrate binding protein [Bradyrhizobium sp. LHD-71]